MMGFFCGPKYVHVWWTSMAMAYDVHAFCKMLDQVLSQARSAGNFSSHKQMGSGFPHDDVAYPCL